MHSGNAPDKDGLIADTVAAIQSIPELITDPRHARLIRGVLERQIILMARLSTIEARLEALEGGIAPAPQTSG